MAADEFFHALNLWNPPSEELFYDSTFVCICAIEAIHFSSKAGQDTLLLDCGTRLWARIFLTSALKSSLSCCWC